MSRAAKRPSQAPRAASRPSASPRPLRAAAKPLPAVGARHESRGRELLCALPENGAELGRKLGGYSRATVGHWRQGVKVPGAEARIALEELGIPRASWEQVPDSMRAKEPARRKTPAPATALEHVTELLEAIREARLRPDVAPSEKIRAASEERALIAQRARLQREADASDAAIEALCVQHPRWKALRDALVAALRPHREAHQAIGDVLRAFGADVPEEVA